MNNRDAIKRFLLINKAEGMRSVTFIKSEKCITKKSQIPFKEKIKV